MNDMKIVAFAVCFYLSDWFKSSLYVGQTSICNLKKSAELAALLWSKIEI